jgi:hypothetical protein
LPRPQTRTNAWALSALPVFTTVWTGEAIWDLGELLTLGHR